MQDSGSIRRLPSRYDSAETRRRVGPFEWFYAFQFANEVSTRVADPLVDTIHRTRAELVLPFLDEMFCNRWDALRCVDIACHQGWFAAQLALRGAHQVIGFDVRSDHIHQALLIRDLAGLENLTYLERNLFDNQDDLGKFDVCLFLGLLYHVENPLGALRRARELTLRVCVIETQVARGPVEMQVLNGSNTTPRSGSSVGVFAADEGHAERTLPLVLVPTLQALYDMLYAVGFDRVYLAVPQRTMYTQYPDWDRVVVFAQVT